MYRRKRSKKCKMKKAGVFVFGGAGVLAILVGIGVAAGLLIIGVPAFLLTLLGVEKMFAIRFVGGFVFGVVIVIGIAIFGAPLAEKVDCE